MNRRLLIGIFADEEDLMGAAQAARDRRLAIVDVYAPYPVHGLDKVMGLAPSRLSVVCLVGGVLGMVLAFWFQFWTTATDWPINVGGRPWNSWPAFVAVAFELMVLCAGLGVVFAFFAVSKLFPGKHPALIDPAVTTSRFVLVVEENNAAFNSSAVRRLFNEFHALDTEEREQQDFRPDRPRRGLLPRLNVSLLVVFLGIVGLNWVLGADHNRPNLELLPDMAHSVRYDAFAPNPNFASGRTLQAPVLGTIARGQMPLYYRATPQDALRAGEELHNPFSDSGSTSGRRGLWIYTNYCQVCHGAEGKGDGPVTRRGVPPPPALFAEKTRNLKDGQLFHILTYGQGNMPSYAGQIARQDRWRAILHVRLLQKQNQEKGKP